MALRVKFPIVDRRVAFSPGGAFSKETIGREFARMAAADIAQIDRENAAFAGRKLPMKTFLDGAEKEPIPAFVDPESAITARWQIAVGAVADADGLLAISGPRKSGDYRKHRAIYADRARVGSAADIPPGAREVMIVSLVPYARKIERGRGGYAPGAVYQAVAAIMMKRYGNAARIKFTFAEPEGAAGQLDAWANGRARAVGNSRKRQAQLAKDRRNPAIIFYLT